VREMRFDPFSLHTACPSFLHAFFIHLCLLALLGLGVGVFRWVECFFYRPLSNAAFARVNYPSTLSLQGWGCRKVSDHRFGGIVQSDG
jgi:hypothetical protein